MLAPPALRPREPAPQPRAQVHLGGLADHALIALVVHRMLTAEQLSEMLTPQATGTGNWRRRLNQLRRAGLVETMCSYRGWRSNVWHATRPGIQRVLTDPDHTRSYQVPASSILQAHTLAVNDVGLAFVRAARNRGDDCDWASWDHEVAHTFATTHRNRRTALIADAVLTYTTKDAAGPGRSLRCFIELDRATQPAHKLAAKIRTYADYHRWEPARPDTHGVPAGEPGWRGRYTCWPPLCVIIGANPAKTPDAIERRIDQIIRLCAADHLTVCQAMPVYICRFDTLTAQGPWAPIWWRPDNPRTPVDLTGRPA